MRRKSVRNYILFTFLFSILISLGVLIRLVTNLQNSLDLRSQAAPQYDSCFGQSYPTCGSDEKNYFNSCQARDAGAMADCSGQCPCTREVYFQFQTGFGKTAAKGIFKLTEDSKITQARKLLKNNCYTTKDDIPACENSIIQASVIPFPQKVNYNQPWHFGLEPKSITFVNVAPEICDMGIEGVETAVINKKQLGPQGNIWCPWTFQLVREVPYSEIKRM